MLHRSMIKFKPISKIIVKSNQSFDYTMFFDGCSKGNPGLAGAGAVIYNNDEEYWYGSTFVGKTATNNEAEYTGLIFGLQQALDMNIKSLMVKGDSLLVIKQMRCEYKCNSINLLPLYEKAKKLEKSFDNIQFTHVLRNFNKRADELSNIALNNYLIPKL